MFYLFFWLKLCHFNEITIKKKKKKFCALHAGNKKSLVDAMEKGINLREQILKLYRDYYHGGIMKLVVIGGGEVFFSDS